MRILFVISSLGQGGAERVLSVLANYLSQFNEVFILKFDSNEPFYKISSNIKIFDTQSGVGDRGFFGNIVKRVDKIFALRRFLKQNKQDVVISFLDTTNILVLIANLGLKNKIIITEHTNHTFLKSKIYKALKRIFYPFASALTVLTRFDYDHYTYVKNKVIMPNPMFEVDQKFLNLKKQNLILAAGRLITHKGFDTFLRSLSLVDKKLLERFEVIIAGDGDEKENLKNLANSLGIKVSFVGFVQDLQRYYAKAKIVIVTSRAEGFCNILMESVYFNCARISTDCIAGPRELIKDGFDGFLVEVDNEKAIANKLEILMKNETLRNEFVKNANLKKDEFKIENIGKKWINLIKNLTGDGN